jgi:hypothetical protein
MTPAARALFEANTKARSQSTSRGEAKSRIFQPSSVSSGSRSSFGSALRNSYTPGSVGISDRKERGRDDKSVSSSTMVRRAAEGGTPRCRQLR